MVWSITRAESYVRGTVKSMKPRIQRGLKRMGDVKPSEDVKKKKFPAPLGDAGEVTYIQPRR